MRILITAGPTREAIDAVRYISNRSSGRMGAGLTAASLRQGHETTLIVGPVSVPMPDGVRRIEVETAQQMHDAVMAEFPRHDLLIMAAAVADYRPKHASAGKLPRGGSLTIELEATDDIAAAAGRMKRPDQRTVGFSLEGDGGVDRARQKLHRKSFDLIVYNPVETMERDDIGPILVFPDGRQEEIPKSAKDDFADLLVRRAIELFS